MMNDSDLIGAAYDEAQRLLEKEFSFFNPGVCEIYAENVPHSQKEKFCRLVEGELLEKGEKIRRYGEVFSIERFQTSK